MIIHDGKNDVSLVFDRGEGNGSYHHYHKVEGLGDVSGKGQYRIDGRVGKSPNLLKSPMHSQGRGSAKVQFQQDIAKSCQASR